MPRHVSEAGVGQGGFLAGGLGTALLLRGDKSSSLWGWLGTLMGLEGGKHSLACLINLVSRHCTAFNGFTHPSSPAGWGRAAQPLGLRGKPDPWGH